LTVKSDGNRLLVLGGFPLGTWEGPSSDLLAEYRKAPKNWSKEDSGKDSPHIRFANANTDERLIAFVEQYGPVIACDLYEDKPGYGSRLGAMQDMEELRQEQILYSAAVTLVSLLSNTEEPDEGLILDCISQIVKCVKDWPRQWERERKLRGGNWELDPEWRFGRHNLEIAESYESAVRWKPQNGKRDVLRIFGVYGDPVDEGHNLMCELVNAFRLRAYRWGNKTVEGPNPDLRYGVRPLLYYLLRRVYLSKNSIAICANERCREVFEIEREGQRFCDATCSQHQRQREYWATIGKEKRQERQEHKRTSAKRAGQKRKGRV
jgi:hypothetical protein